MTPPPDYSADRRNFMKKSLATSASISLAGLVRAHGEVDPVAPPPGTTTTQSTYATTTVPTHCRRHGSQCIWVESILVNFTKRTAHTDATKTYGNWSGHIFSGTLTYQKYECLPDGRILAKGITCNVVSGGYFDSNFLLRDGKDQNGVFKMRICDTPCPGGKYKIIAKPGSNGGPFGFFFVQDPPKRVGIKVHLQTRPGTAGCIAFVKNPTGDPEKNWKDFLAIMQGNANAIDGNGFLIKSSACPHNGADNKNKPLDPVVLEIKYSCTPPYYLWNPNPTLSLEESLPESMSEVSSAPMWEPLPDPL